METGDQAPFGHCDQSHAGVVHARHVHIGIDQLPWECPGVTEAQALADEDYWAWQQDGCEPTPRAFCDVYGVHEPHWYRALNHNDYSCPGLTLDELAEIERIEAEPLCEHQLSRRQCGGPMHWYDESNRQHLGR